MVAVESILDDIHALGRCLAHHRAMAVVRLGRLPSWSVTYKMERYILTKYSSRTLRTASSPEHWHQLLSRYLPRHRSHRQSVLPGARSPVSPEALLLQPHRPLPISLGVPATIPGYAIPKGSAGPQCITAGRQGGGRSYSCQIDCKWEPRFQRTHLPVQTCIRANWDFSAGRREARR
jgi:hypothetical protein